MSRGLRILVGIAAILYIGALVAVVYTLAEQQTTDTRIDRAEKFDPCVSLSEAVANKAADRIKPLTRECREFLTGIGPLVTIKLSCAIIEKARYVCPAPGTKGASRSGPRAGVPLGPTLMATPTSGGDGEGGIEIGDTGGSGPPSRRGGGKGQHKPDSRGPEAPPGSNPDPQEPGPTSTTSGPVESPAQSNPGNGPEDPGQSGLVKPALEGVGKTVQDTGKAVGPLTCAVTGLLHPCQP